MELYNLTEEISNKVLENKLIKVFIMNIIKFDGSSVEIKIIKPEITRD